MFRKLLPLQLLADLVIGAVFLLLALLNTWSGTGFVDIVALLVFSAALAIRRLSPTLALIIAWAGALLQMAAGLLVAAGPLSNFVAPPTVPAFSDFAILAVLFATAAYGGWLLRWIGLGSALLGSVLATAYILLAPFTQITFQRASTGFHSGVIILFGSLALLGLSWTLGLLTRTWRRARDSRAQQVEARRDVIVEQERNRIARDMHDVVAHSLAVVIAQADGARYARASHPEAVDAALATISTTAREALGDVRILLTQLRHSQGEAPQPVLADIDRLIEQLEAAGLTIERESSGDAPGLPSGQQLAVFRIVQEALTNALRHGDVDRPVSVRFDWSNPAEIRIVNFLGDCLPDPLSIGHGLAGMRERASLTGGSLNAGPTGDQWIVSASIPMQAATAEPIAVTQ